MATTACSGASGPGPASLGAAPGNTLGSATSLRLHHLHELVEIDLVVHVGVGLLYHLVHLTAEQLLPKVVHGGPELIGADEAIAISVEDLESLDQLLLCVRVLHLPGHQRQELREVDGPVAIRIDL